jgi:hypothetical protein
MASVILPASACSIADHHDFDGNAVRERWECFVLGYCTILFSLTINLLCNFLHVTFFLVSFVGDFFIVFGNLHCSDHFCCG